MLIGTPVLARRNGGNASLITHQETGLLFDSAEELISQAKRLLTPAAGTAADAAAGLGRRLAVAAREHVATAHSESSEAIKYREAVAYATSTRGGTPRDRTCTRDRTTHDDS